MQFKQLLAWTLVLASVFTAAHLASTRAGVPPPFGAPGGRAGMGGGATPAADLHLPPLTIHGSKLTLDEVISQFSGALGVPSGFIAGPGASGDYGLDAQDKPFWEIFTAFSRKYNIGLSQTFRNQTRPGGIQLQSGGDVVQRCAIDGPVVGILNKVIYRRTRSLQTTPDVVHTTSQLEFPLLVGIDPRLSVQRFTFPSSTIASQEEGAVLAKSGSYGGGALDQRTGNWIVYPLQLTLAAGAPDKPLNLDVPISLTAGVITPFVVEDPEHNTNKPIPVGNNILTINSFRVDASGIQILMSIRPDFSGRGGPMGAPPTAFPVSVVNADGKVLGEAAVGMGAAPLRIPVKDAQGPFILVCRTISDVQEVRAILTFRNVPPP